MGVAMGVAVMLVAVMLVPREAEAAAPPEVAVVLAASATHVGVAAWT